MQIIYIFFFILGGMMTFQVPADELQDSINVQPLVQANNQFGLQLFGELTNQSAQENVVVSPLSVAVALAMAHNGAAAETQAAMKSTLQVDKMSLEKLNYSYQTLLKLLQTSQATTQLSIANSLWMPEKLPILEAFLQTTQDIFQAEVKQLNFQQPTAVDQINDWVKQATKEKITEIVKEIPARTVLFLLNAVYFKSQWLHQFAEENTTEQPFHLLNGETQPVPMMQQKGEFLYLDHELFQGVKMPYSEGNHMTILLPKPQVTVAKLRQAFKLAKWQDWQSQFKTTPGEIHLPRFKLAYEADLKPILSTLGMGIAFDSGNADFSNMIDLKAMGDNVYLSEVKHKTFIEVNEEGTEAAAVTQIRATVRSIRFQPKPFKLVVDRPFMFLISHDKSESIIFIGQVTQP